MVIVSMKSKTSFIIHLFLLFRHFINLNFADGKGNYNSHPFNQHGSDMKVRLPTSESMESNNSTQFNYIRNHPQANFGGMNLNSGGNYQYFFDEE